MTQNETRKKSIHLKMDEARRAAALEDKNNQAQPPAPIKSTDRPQVQTENSTINPSA